MLLNQKRQRGCTPRQMDDNTSINSSYCFHLPDPTFHRASHRYTMNLISAIINIVTAPLAIITNILVVTAVFGSSRLRTPSNLFIACLALSDVFFGLTAQSGYIILQTHGKPASLSSLFCDGHVWHFLLRVLWSVFHDFNRCKLRKICSCSTTC